MTFYEILLYNLKSDHSDPYSSDYLEFYAYHIKGSITNYM